MSTLSQVNIIFQKPVHKISLSNNVINPILAVQHQDCILFYDQQGKMIEGKDIIKKSLATQIEWHPIQKILAIGWKSGVISLYSEENNSLRDDQEVHKNPIILLKYNPSGSRMVTCDDSGLVCVWRGLTCLSGYQRQGTINHCCFAELNLDSNQKLGNLFFFGGSQGIVTLADDSNHLSEICKVGGSIAALQFYAKQNSVIIISSSLLLVQFKISTTDKNSAPEKKVKLSIAGDPEKLMSQWIEDCLLCSSSNENMIRLWNLDEDENYVLTLFDQNIINDKILQVKYDSKGKLLVGGTQEGRLVFWKNRQEIYSENEYWNVIKSEIQGQGVVKQISIINGTIAALYENNVILVQETLVTAKVFDKIQIMQINKNSLDISVLTDTKGVLVTKFSTNKIINGFDVYAKKFLVYYGRNIEIYEILVEINQIKLSLFSTITQDCRKALFTDQLVISQFPGQINVLNYQGNVKQQISFPESEGYINDISILNNILITHTNKNLIKIFDLSRKEAKQIGNSRKFQDSQGNSLGEIIISVANKTSNRILIINKQKQCFMYDLEVDTIKQISENINKAVWDNNDERFFAVQKSGGKNQFIIETYFYSTENGAKHLDTYPCEQKDQQLFKLIVPNIYYTYFVKEEFQIKLELMKDFRGLDSLDEITITSIMNFNFNLCIGNLDEAYKSIKQVSNPIIWENMAQMCVKTGRLDVAEICIGNMRFARGAKAVRESKKEPEIQAKLGMVAIQLGMLQEAEDLYRQCGRYDLLNKMHQAAGNWKDSVKISQTYDRINLKNTYYNAAKLLETQRNFSQAAEYYELAECYQTEVPRMYLQAGQLENLYQYIQSKNDKQLYTWWGQYQECNENFENAIKYYKLGEDFGSLVRIMINQNDIEGAKKFCQSSNSSQASYILAKQLELQGILQEAMIFYAKAQHYSHAVRIARELQLDSEVMSLSLMSQPRCINQSAVYFQSRGFNEKAIILYIKAKNIKKALNLAVKSKLYDYIEKITYNIGQDEDVEVLAQVAEYFIANNNFDKAVHLLVASKQVERALEIFVQNNIPITDEIADKLLPKDFDENDPKNVQIMKTIADKAKKQGNFDLAAKLYRQLKDNIKAMKCMCKLNDTNKVIAFAQNARNAEMCVIAANYLQSADWNSSPELVKYIVSFYTRAKAFDRLGQFYETCAGVEIDEYKDYPKAIAALKESAKFWNKAGMEDKAQFVSSKIFLIEKYLQALSYQMSDPQEMVKICQSLAQNPNFEQAIRIGDLFAPIIETFYSQGNLQSAYQYLKVLQEKQIHLQLYLNKDVIIGIQKQFGNIQKPPQSASKQSVKSQKFNNENEVFEEEEIDEEIV